MAVTQASTRLVGRIDKVKRDAQGPSGTVMTIDSQFFAWDGVSGLQHGSVVSFVPGEQVSIGKREALEIELIHRRMSMEKFIEYCAYLRRKEKER